MERVRAEIVAIRSFNGIVLVILAYQVVSCVGIRHSYIRTDDRGDDGCGNNDPPYPQACNGEDPPKLVHFVDFGNGYGATSCKRGR